MSRPLDHIIDCQSRLIEAMDARDAAALEQAVADLAAALAELDADGAVFDIDLRRIDHAVYQAEAARIRVNILSHWTRQRIDRLAEIRTGSPSGYGNQRNFAG